MTQMIAVIARRTHDEEPPEAPAPPRTQRRGTHRQAVGFSMQYLRIRLHLDVRDISEATGIGTDVLERIERGDPDTKESTVKDLMAIASVLNCELRITWRESSTEETTLDRIFNRGGKFRLHPLPPARKKPARS